MLGSSEVIIPLFCSGRGAVDRAAVWAILEALQEPSEDPDLHSLSSSLQQLAATDSEYSQLTPP